jgi:RND superfamily putative drug exporter
MHSLNLAARAGRWSAQHWKTATFGWLAFVVAALVVGQALGTKNIDPNDTVPGESGEMTRILDAGFKQPAGESVLIQSTTLRAEDPRFQAAVDDVLRRVSAIDVVTNVRSPLEEENRGQISRDRRSALIQFDIRGDADEATEKVDPVLAAVADTQRAHPELFIGAFGDASANKALEEQFAKDLEKAGYLSLPVTLIILVLAFGALVAAGIPLLLALTAVLATMGLLAFPSQLMPVDEYVSAVVLLIGLAVGVDYTMFYLKREREERAAGRGEEAALEAAAATSGRAVLISGITVMIAMAGMFFTGDPTFSSFALATIIVVAMAVLGSLTVLPALLAKLGDRVNKGRLPFLGRAQARSGGRLWGAVLDRVLRRPLVSAIAAAALLVALALPALGLRLVNPGIESFPRSLEVMTVYDRLQAAFPGEQIPAEIVVKADNVRSPEFQEALGQLEWRALSSGQFLEPITTDVNREGTVAHVSLPLVGDGADDRSLEALATLRGELLPTTVGAVRDAEVGVTGFTATSKDFNEQTKSSAPWVFAFVLSFAFLLLLASFRSLVVAIKAILLNLLSVAAAYGVLVLVFQHGYGKDILGFDTTGGISAFLPIFMFVILFGLSMDYHVFILSRIREAFDRGMKTEEAVTYGIKSTASVVTSAAMVMVFVFAIFATLPLLMFKQIGVGLATAILIDATIVRAVLLPATMKLLGDWNWYLPRWLRWLPKLEQEQSAGGQGEPQPGLSPAGR